MSVFSELLGRKLEPGADAFAAECLTHIGTGARRLSLLLDDLLAYSKVGTSAERASEDVDLDAVLSAVVASLGASIKEQGAEILSDPLPRVRGSSAQLAEVLQNLFSNAIKYRRPGVAPRIHVRVKRQEDKYLFSVEDNGEGFSAEYSESIFGIFKRLHGDDIEGTGIGLALCRRVIERHGGRIWAVSTRNAGSTFYFTLPA